MNNLAPRWLLWVSIILLLWNLMGVGAFAGQWMMTPEQSAALSPAEQKMWASMPGWAWAAYATAVFAGTVAAIGLLMRKKWAVPAFLTSLIAVLVQFAYPFIIADGLSSLGGAALLFPAFITLVAIVQWRLAITGRTNNWLN